MQKDILLKLKQTMIDKEYSNRFSELIHPKNRINTQEKVVGEPIIIQNAILPSISHNKLPLADRSKSHSAKKIISKQELERNKNTRSNKRLFNEPTPRSQKVDFEDLIIKKQGNEGILSKQALIRTKVFSLKTPSRQGQHNKQSTQTKDLTHAKDAIHRRMSIKQFSARMDKLNEQIYLLLKEGRFDYDNPDYKKMLNFMTKLKRNNEEEHRKLEDAIQNILRFVRRHNIKGGVIQFKRILPLISRKVLSNYQIINTFLNKENILQKHRIAGLQFYTSNPKIGQDLAAAKISAFFKMIFSKRFYNNLSALIKKVKIIQQYWRTCLLAKRTRKQMLRNINGKISRYEKLQKQLCSQWNIIKTCNRYEIHVCSYSMEEFKRLTVKNLKQKENNQITRIFKAYETDVNIIYVLPFQLHEQIIKYYQSIFGFSATTIQQKIYFIVPENRQKIQKYCPITTVAALMYSPKALKRIRQIVGKQYTYIVPSFPSIEYVNLAAELNVPIFGPNQSIAKLYSTKSGGLKMLSNAAKKQKCPFQTLKSVVSIFSQKELINTLSILIYKNKEIKTWHLKIEDQIHSRGLAYLNINKIALLREICSGASEFQEVKETQMIKLIAEELNCKLRNRLKIINKDIYSNYDQYISHFLTRGGVIQAGIQQDQRSHFSISFLIQPSGQFSIIGTYNKLELNGKSINQAIRFPSLLKAVDYQGITRHLYKELYLRKKIFGYFTADFVYAEATQTSYAIGLDCFLNEKISSLFMVNFCCGTHFEKDRNALVNYDDRQKYYIYCPSLTLLKMPAIIPFFKSCKFQNISYDLEKKLGTVFVPLDRLQSQQIGFIAVEDNYHFLLKQMKKMVEHFCKQYRQAKNSHDEIGLLKGAVTTNLRKFQKEQVSQTPNIDYLF